MAYPYAIRDWTRAEEYPAAEALSLGEWAWEFLRRNPEYQRLFDWFETLPDCYTLQDGSPSNKNGKWKGTPWRDFRFFEGGACWYADPPPIPGESTDEYDERTGGGHVMPFADYLCSRFKAGPSPRHPRLPYDLPNTWEFGFFDVTGTEVPPFDLDVFSLLDPLEYRRPEVLDEIRERYRDPAKLTLTFDVRKNLDIQLERARDMIKDQRELLGADDCPDFRPVRKTKAQVNQFPVYVRLLDAEAAGAAVADMAATIYRGVPNTRADGFRVSTKIRQNLAAAKRLRDGGYWDMLG